MRWRVLVLLIGVMSFFSESNAQFVRYANSYLQLGYSAQQEALGRSALASPYSLGSERSNAAALTGLEKRFSAGASYSSIFSGLGSLFYTGNVMRLDSVSSIGIGLLSFSVGGIQNTLRWRNDAGEDDYGRIRRFSVADYAFFLSYGRKVLYDGISVGGTAKILYRDQGGFATGIGMGVDLSAMYSRPNWNVALVARDITSTWVLWFINSQRLSVVQEGNELNPSTRRAAEGTLPSLDLAFSYHWALPHDFQLGTSATITTLFDGKSFAPLNTGSVTFAPALGVWASYHQWVFLRLGAHQLQYVPISRDKQALSFTPAGGLGIQGWGIRIDYALTAPLAAISARWNHLVTVSYRWGKIKKLL